MRKPHGHVGLSGQAPFGRRVPALLVLGMSQPAFAGGMEVVSPAVPVVVVVDGKVVGPTPVRVEGLSAGSHTVGLRAETFAATVITESVLVPQDGTVAVRVDWPAQRLVVDVVAPPGPPPAALPPSASVLPSGPPAPPAWSGDLFVSADIEGAMVLLDGEEVGRTPVLLEGVSEGPHRVDLRTTCARGGQDVQVARDVVTRTELRMERGQGVLTVSSMPSTATVRVDGVDVGLSPVRLEVACGSHAVEVRSVGFLPVTRTLDVPAFETVPVSVALEAERSGRLSVLPTPVEALVTLDGVVLGPGPRTVDPVSVGTHDLVVSAAGYEKDGRVVDVAPDAVTRVEVTLVLERASTKVRWGRLALDGAPAVGGVVLAALAIGSYGEASNAYDRYLAVTSDSEATRVWDEEVAPARNRGLAEAVGAGVLLLGSGYLWWSTDFTVGLGPGWLGVEGRW